jgi:Mce-associated membrane protein
MTPAGPGDHSGDETDAPVADSATRPPEQTRADDPRAVVEPEVADGVVDPAGPPPSADEPPQVDPGADPTPASEPEAPAVADAAPTAEPAPTADAELTAVADPPPTPDAEPAAVVEPAPAGQPDAAAVAEPAPAAGPEPTPEPTPDSDAAVVAEPTPAGDADLEAEPAPGTDAPAESEPAPQPDPVAEPGPEPMGAEVPTESAVGAESERPPHDEAVPAGSSAAWEPFPPSTGTRGDGSRLLAVVLAALVVLAVAGTGYLAWQLRKEAQTDEARTEALLAARDAARLLFSYDHTRLKEDFQAGLATTTGEFREEYDRTTRDVVTPVATEYDAVVAAEVVESGVVSAERDEVVVLVYVNQTTTSTRVEGPRIDQSRVRMALRPVDGEWRVAEVDAL